MTTSFSLQVETTSGACASGERWAADALKSGSIPVLSCEGPCIRGEIARLTANLLSHQPPYARACFAEAALVPHSTMTHWVREAAKVLVIDGCFLHCMRRLMSGIVAPDRVVHFDTLKLHKRYSKIFHMDDVPPAEREETAKESAAQIVALLNGSAEPPACGDRCS